LRGGRDGHAKDTHGDKYIQSFGAKTEGKRPLEKPIRKLEDNTKTDLISDGKNLTRLICVMILAKGGISQTSNKPDRNDIGN
jgi:hypothetical protein